MASALSARDTILSLGARDVCTRGLSSANRNSLAWKDAPGNARVTDTGAQRSIERREAMFKICDAIRSTCTEDGAVLLDIHQGRILGLNKMGSRVFEMLRGGLDQEQIAGEISQEFGVDADYARTDVLDFIKTLQQHNVLQASRLD